MCHLLSRRPLVLSPSHTSLSDPPVIVQRRVPGIFDADAKAAGSTPPGLAPGRTGPAGIARWPRNDGSTAPCLFVPELPAELEPALIENRAVQSGLGADV